MSKNGVAKTVALKTFSLEELQRLQLQLREGREHVKAIDALKNAVENGEVMKVQKLLKTNEYSQTVKSEALVNAIKLRQSKIMKMLLEAKAKPTSVAIFKAIEFGTLEDLQSLIQSCESRQATDRIFDATDGNLGTILHAAAYYGKFDMVKYLVNSGMEQRPNGTMKWTPLHAVLNLQVDHKVKEDQATRIAMFLIYRGANINARDKHGFTIITHAVSLENEFLVQTLIDFGAKFKESGFHEAIFASIKNESTNMFEILMRNGLDVNKRYEVGSRHFKLLHYATEVANLNVIKLLIENGANINEKDDLQTPLHISLIYKRREITKFLIRNGASINLKVKINNETVTPLHLAILYSWQDIIEHLVTNGADINALDWCNDSPLHYAVQTNNEEAVKLLLKNAADLSIKNANNQTALDVAKDKKYQQILEILAKKIIETKEAENGNNPPKAKRFKLDDCVICCTARNDVFVFHPCGHAKTCETCTMKIMYISEIGSNCPVCRQKVDNYVKAFI